MIQNFLENFFLHYLISVPYVYGYIIGFVTVWGTILALDLGRFFHFLVSIHGKVRKADKMMQTMLLVIILFNITTTTGIAYSNAGSLMELIIILNILFGCYMIKVTDFLYRVLLVIDPTPDGIILSHDTFNIMRRLLRFNFLRIVDIGSKIMR